MAAKKSRSPESVSDEGIRPRTPTAGRRHRPSSKASNVKTSLKTRAKAQSKATTGKGNSNGRATKPRMRAEDKREDPDEMVTNARPKNIEADKDSKKNKGKSTHALEASSPGKRPSRKSTRRSANHMKRDSQQRRQTMREVRSPKSRHDMGSA